MPYLSSLIFGTNDYVVPTLGLVFAAILGAIGAAIMAAVKEN